MAYSYGPSKKPGMCNPRKVQVQSVIDRHDDTRSHPVQLTVLTIENGADSGHEQWLRLTRLEAQTLLEALRRVLESEISASWSPAALEGEVLKVMQNGAMTETTCDGSCSQEGPGEHGKTNGFEAPKGAP